MTHPSEPARERGEVEGKRAAAAPSAAPSSAIVVCIAPGDHDGWHVYHRIENLSVIEQEGEGHGPR